MARPGNAGLTAQRLGDANPYVPQGKERPSDTSYMPVYMPVSQHQDERLTEIGTVDEGKYH